MRVIVAQSPWWVYLPFLMVPVVFTYTVIGKVVDIDS